MALYFALFYKVWDEIYLTVNMNVVKPMMYRKRTVTGNHYLSSTNLSSGGIRFVGT